MSKKNRSDKNGFVYSTDPDFKFQADEATGAAETAAPAKQKLRVWLETKQRGGKPATVITGFSGLEADLEDLGKKLKAFCGTGGSVKDGEIIVQGEQREKVLGWLLKNGYTGAKKSWRMMPVLVGAAATCGLVGVVSYVLYARARMKENEAAEGFYLRVHYISMFLLFAIGVVIMFYMGEHSD